MLILVLTTLVPIDLSPAANTGLGDPLRVGGKSINDNEAKLFTLARVVQESTLQVFKAIGNPDINILEPGDAIAGWFTSTLFIKLAIYVAGSPGDIASYNVLDSTEF